MRKEILSYLKKPYNACFVALAIVAMVGFCVLFFKPYQIHTWVTTHQLALFWSEIGVLAAIVVTLLWNIAAQHTHIEQLAQREEVTEQPQMLNFYDERGELKLSVKPEHMYYLESADNYVRIHYSSMNKMQTVMIRNSMKNVEWRFRESKLVRCHRSYLVNLANVQIARRVEGDIWLDFNNNQIPSMPVSKAYADQVMAYFAQ
ncbi:MAG: LytTR family transcriptional regulator [Paludibacteraceae bacterium]|nr:LytTR family transcriptional regulator [Paludibacteraceae bacterium]